MKKSNIAKITALRNALNRYAYQPNAMIQVIKDYLGEELSFEFSTTTNNRNHEAYNILIFDKNGDTCEIVAELCADKKEFTFNSIGLEESVRLSDVKLALGMDNVSRIGTKQAWVVPFAGEKIGLWKVLVSYSTVIAAWNVNSNVIYLQRNARNYSNTTRRHLSDFEAHVNRALKITNETAVLKWANWK